jgi:hypothetical protein
MRSDPVRPVYRITGARRSLDEDVRSRQVRYAISMGIRTACFVLALVTTGWVRWAFAFGAVFLPYFAVVFANGGREPDPGLAHTLLTPANRELGPTPDGAPRPE